MTTLLTGRRVAVIGATGFIGSHLVERLVADGAEVLAIARTRDRLDHLSAVRHACAVALCDITAGAHVRRLLHMFRPDTVFHLAAHPDAAESFAHMSTCLQVNTLGVVNVLDAAAESGARLLVFGDSCKVYGNSGVPYGVATPARPICSYAVAKAAAWQLCLVAAASSPLRVVGLRPTFVYGPRQTWNLITYIQSCVAAGRPVSLQGGSQTRDPLYVADAVDAFVAAASRPEAHGQAIPIGGGMEISVADLSDRVLATLGSSLRPVIGGDAPRPTEIWRSVSDNHDALALLRWRPRVTLADGLRRTLNASVAMSPLTSRDVSRDADTDHVRVVVP